MKAYYWKPLQLSTLLIFSSLSFAGLCYAEKIYTWKDESGKMHYTNNPSLVPLKKNAHIIKMKALPTPEPAKEPLNGEQLWQNLCAQCHHIETESFKGMQGMPKLIEDIKDTNTPPENSLEILRAAIRGDMDNNIKTLSKLNYNELIAIITYITDQVVKSPSLPAIKPKEQ